MNKENQTRSRGQVARQNITPLGPLNRVVHTPLKRYLRLTAIGGPSPCHFVCSYLSTRINILQAANPTSWPLAVSLSRLADRSRSKLRHTSQVAMMMLLDRL